MSPTIFEIIDALENHPDDIQVRELVNGRWGDYVLTDLPVPLALKHALRFIRKMQMPTRRIPHH